MTTLSHIKITSEADFADRDGAGAKRGFKRRTYVPRAVPSPADVVNPESSQSARERAAAIERHQQVREEAELRLLNAKGMTNFGGSRSPA
jgi:hypothetical protein